MKSAPSIDETGRELIVLLARAHLFTGTDAPLDLSDYAPVDQAGQDQTRSRIKNLLLSRPVTLVSRGADDGFGVESDTLCLVEIAVSGGQGSSSARDEGSGLIKSRDRRTCLRVLNIVLLP